jgi:hypothetical protein
MGLATGDPERDRPARLDCDLGRLPLVGGAVDLLAALGLAEGGAAEGPGGRWYRREAAASPDGVSCLEGRGLTGSMVWPAMTCVGVTFEREKGPTPDGVVGPRTWQMTRTASVTR